MESNNIEHSEQISLNIHDTPNNLVTEPIQQPKNKLKMLFDEIDTEKKKIQKSKKSNLNKNQITKEDEKFKTKPTKPDFSQQIQINKVQKGISNIFLNNSTQYKGLNNYGNICYSNVVMQSLMGVFEFSQMLNAYFKKIEDLDSIEDEFPIFYNLVKIMSYYKSISIIK
jgi:ubiquitin C-terminal hydrolase